MMTHQRKNRIVAMLLTAVMIIGMVPTITHAAEEPKVESFMKLERAFDFDLVSALCNSEESGNYQNYYTSAVTRGGLSGNPLEWTLLSYAMDTAGAPPGRGSSPRGSGSRTAPAARHGSPRPGR